jgi:hypothetical protein
LAGVASSTLEASAEGALSLRASERSVLASEAQAFASALKPADAERFSKLSIAAEEGAIPNDLLPALDTLLELLLSTQRVRRQHGHEAEESLKHLFARTPRGSRLREAASLTNEALAGLAGRTLTHLAFTPTPSGHRLELEVEGARLSLLIDRGGVHVESVEVAA